MLHREEPAVSRTPRTLVLSSDFVVVGGGIAGFCAAVTAARAGLKVILVHDRPVLGGNASSEVRLWLLGATAHGNSNNRWAREPGVINEISLENLYRNPEGNAPIFDTVLLDLAVREPNLTLLLNTAVCACTKDPRATDRIASVRAFNSQNSTLYELRAPLFCDASGDGILGFTAGAAFRMGAESRDEFGEKFAPDESYGSLLGHSMYFYARDTGRPVAYTPPSFALTPAEIESRIPRYRDFHPKDDGCRLWWIEFGGRLDTIHETERIKWELWRVAYGVWNYFKNSGRFPETANLTLEWIGTIPGKRESRRFEGDAMLTQQDVVEARTHDDDVAFGGWAMDLHPADGVYSDLAGCTHWRGKTIYPIPYRCLYSRNVRNLFLAGRIISASHAAYGSSRVMGTLGLCAQAVGMAAMLCHQHDLQPRDLARGDNLAQLQLELLRIGQHIPGRALHDPLDWAHQAQLSASSELRLAELPADAPPRLLRQSVAQLLPVMPGKMPRVTVTLDVTQATTLQGELRACTRPDGHTPDLTLASCAVELQPGLKQEVTLDFAHTMERPRYVFVCLLRNEAVAVHRTRWNVTGLLSVHHSYNQEPAQGKVGHGHIDARMAQRTATDLGVDTFEIWHPQRRPEPQNLALRLDPPVAGFAAENVRNGIARPTCAANAWVADLRDPAPTLSLKWDKPRTISRIVLEFDPDWEHPMETVLMGHPERIVPHCVRKFAVRDGSGQLLHQCAENHLARREITLAAPTVTDALHIEIKETGPHAPASLFSVRCYER